MAVRQVTRREFGTLLAGAALAVDRTPALRIGLSISDTLTLDPARQINYSPSLTIAACYDTLVTYLPGSYTGVVPALAASWARTPDGKGWRFTLRPDVRFASGAPVTADDWAFSLRRVLAIGDLPAQFLENVADVAATGTGTLDITLKVPDQPILGVLATPAFGVLERRVVEAQGGTDASGAERDDHATEWLNQQSAGTGPYVLTGWARNRSIELQANPNWWRGTAAYRRVSIRHLAESVAQERALRRGDIDAAFNLIPEQVVALGGDAGMRVERVSGLDFVYLALNGNESLNPALAHPEVRQAIGAAIDYDDIIGRMLGGQAVRPASFLPIGVRGSTEAVARSIGFKQDLDAARRLLAQAGYGGGMTFELSHGQGAIAGLDYAVLARKLRTDLARVGIRVTTQALDPLQMRTRFFGGRLQAALAFWTQPVVETAWWADAALHRVASRVDFEPAPTLVRLVREAGAEDDGPRQAAMWVEVQQALVAQANLLVLFQPSYQVAVRRTVAALPLTGAGWMADLGGARPAS